MNGKKALREDEASRHAQRVLAIAGEDETLPTVEYQRLQGSYRRLLLRFQKVMHISDTYSAELKRVTAQLDELRALALPICMFCKKIRTDDGYWQQMETYFARHVDVAFSHGICPDCLKEKYGEISESSAAQERFSREMKEITRRTESKKISDTDQYVRAAETLLGSADAPAGLVRDELRRLSDRYRRLLRRMGKILLISDGFQARLIDVNARLDLLARTDGLTQLSNRVDAAEKLEAERSRAERHGTVFSVIIADVDGFKAVNDAHGHEAGDRVLAAIAQTMRGTIRREDACARWGGEEFLLLFPETDGRGAQVLARKLLVAARSLALPYRGTTLRFTLSAGVATFHAGDTVDDVLRNADGALYQAKHAGKDRVETAPY
jgi:diguanylate cyclase